MKTDGLRVLFMGTPDFAVPTLKAIIDIGCTVVGVVSQPDRPRGRGRQLQPTPVAQCAREHELTLYQWERLNQESFETLSALQPDVSVVIAYGKILPQRYLDLPKHGCFNVHASLLPALRGAAPIQWSVIRGHAQAGVTIMRMDAGMDTGDIGLQVAVDIDPMETSGALHDRLAPIGAQAMADALRRLCDGSLTFTPQDHEHATMAPRLAKRDGLIDWSRSAQKIHDHVRGMSPWPGAYVAHAKGPIKILGTRIHQNHGQPGIIIDINPDGPVIGCGEMSVVITRIQRPGRRPVSGADFVRGTDLKVGHALGESIS